LAESWEEVELDELAELVDDEARRRYFTARPALVRAEMARRLAVETGRLVTVDLERAEALCATAIWLDNEIDDLPVRARVLRATANVAYFRRRYKKAVHTYERAIAAFTEIGAELETAITLSSAIGSLGSLSAYDKAMEFASAARPIFERHGDLLRLARLENNVGLVLSRQDRFPEAIEHYRSAHQLFEQLGQPVDMATTLRNIAVCYQDLNDFPAALEA
jgi:tetratricopeptide (TPR) repeat protein